MQKDIDSILKNGISTSCSFRFTYQLSNFLMISFIIFAYDDNIGSDLLLFYTYQHNF